MKREPFHSVPAPSAPRATAAPRPVPSLQMPVWHCPGSSRCGPLRESQLTLDMLAHDLNGVTASMLAAIGQLALRLPDDHPMRTVSDQVRRSAARARELVRLMLDADRRQGPCREACDLQALLQDVVELLQPGLPAHQHLAVCSEPGPHLAWVDRSQFLRALINLCRNALQAMGEGPGRVRLCLASMPSPRGQVRVLIEDDGPGMDSDTLAQACLPYHSTRRAEGGHGLGLAMVDSFVREHGGQLRIDSAPGQGTRVEMLLPMPAVPVAAPDAGTAEPMPDAPAGGRLLYVDDDPVLRLVAETLLAGPGRAVTLAETADQAQRLMAEPGRVFDIVVSDVHLTDGTGFDVLQSAGRWQPAARRYLVSGQCNAELTQRARGEGALALIPKDRFFDPQAHRLPESAVPGVGGPDAWLTRFHQI